MARHRVLAYYAARPTSAQRFIFKKLGITVDEVVFSWETSEILQFLARGSIRDTKSIEPFHAHVWSLVQAEALKALLDVNPAYDVEIIEEQSASSLSSAKRRRRQRCR